jgi:hypothetical protein
VESLDSDAHILSLSRNPNRFMLDTTAVDRFLQQVKPQAHYQKLSSWSCSEIPHATNPRRLVILYTAPPPPFALSAHRRDPNVQDPNLTDNQIIPRSDEIPIVIDTGASWSVTPRVSDFISSMEPAIDSLRSLNGSIEVHGVGTVEWVIQDQNGVVKTIRTKALFVPSGDVRLLSLLYEPQWW